MDTLCRGEATLNALVQGVAHAVHAMNDYELQELVLDWLYMLWRGWSRRQSGGVGAFAEHAKQLEMALHPKLRECMLETCARPNFP